MRIVLQHEIDTLKKLILELSARVEENLRRAMESIKARDENLARKTIDYDETIDRMEVEVEEECLKILALHQPVAIDLRSIISVLKIDNDLERIGDLAVNIAERTLVLAENTLPSDFYLDLSDMADKASIMLSKSLNALVNLDSKAAREVCRADDEVDAMNREVYEEVKKALHKHPESTHGLLNFLSAARHLERIADHATNIAEDIIYMIDGEIVRHPSKNIQSGTSS